MLDFNGIEMKQMIVYLYTKSWRWNIKSRMIIMGS